MDPRRASLLLCLALVVPAAAGCLGGTESSSSGAEAGPDPLAAAKEQWDAFQRKVAANATDTTPPAIEDPGRPSPGATVAVIDTGVNPFHEAFRNPDRTGLGTLPVEAVDTRTGQVPYYVPVEEVETTPEWPAEAVEPETLYRFGGTNLLYYSVLDEVDTLDQGGHGTVTSSTVLSQAPESTVVMVQTNGSTLDEAIGWAVEQPWIDVISVSWGCPVNCAPFYPLDRVQGAAIAETSRQAWQSGKLYVNSAGNDPTPHVTDATDGPPWVVAVGGAEPDNRAEVPDASDMPDVLSNWTVHGPDADSVDNRSDHQGTSFAAPTVAGTFARTLRILRERTGHVGGMTEDGLLVDADGVQVSNADLRSAMNRTAVYWGASDYRPTTSPPVMDPDDTPTPINPAAPWLQMGWGYVNATLAPAMADGILSDDLPSKSEEARTYMAHRQDLRRTLWSS